MLVLVVYDIADDRRRTKLSTFLEGYGRRVQESVFECYLSLAEMKALHQRIARRVKPDEDNVRLYWVPVNALARALTIGSPPPEPPPESYVI
ncbi:CRISPR-associated endonuclease Cas2 [Romeria aff. gracilis LEGE 07310]|uniref:CRISPR-associated endoribonuclease Cas2 n=1 Tax=Vasconcelosia minhoensis LEGE 07310 TaxID=915328 RepID=A0A8J7ADD9_9CYAN|nr:CRISPR-associated endonuclease Cas2 [Romeria gracilis]MBE9077429.1 CRISPR-associated endonuclease Cas2 [Romeria aff. gracilis LEGE 07310]